MDFLSLEKTERHLSSTKEPHLSLRIISTHTIQEPVNASKRILQIAHSNETVEAIYFFQKKYEKLTAQRIEHGHLIQWPDTIPAKIQSHFSLHTMHSVFSETSMGNTYSNRTGKQLLSVPAFGLIDEQWCDGWLGHFSESGNVLSLIPPGTQSRLYVPIGISQCSGISWQEAQEALPPLEELQRQCVIEFLRSTVRSEELTIQIHKFNLEDATCLLLLRQAFPNQDFVVTNSLEKKKWPARFKNFLESIRASWKQSDDGIVVESYFRGISAELLRSLVPLLNKRTKILDGITR